MQGPGCCVLSKTRHTVQETAGIPIWTLSDSCSACAASARRSLFNLCSKHLHCARFLEWKSVCNLCEFTLSSLQKGHVKCNTIKCPALSCENPVAEPQQCCPKCTGLLVVVFIKRERCPSCWLSVSASGDQVRIPAGLRASVKSCRYNGTIYQPGETFNKRDLFPSKQSNQCVMCTCSVSFYLLLYFVHLTQQHVSGKKKLQEPKLNRPEACFQDF